MRRRYKTILAVLAAAVGIAGFTAPVQAAVVRDGSTFTAEPSACSCITTIDGYVFSGMPYYDGSAAVDSAVELWWALAADPSYVPLPPVTSVSTTTTVSGTVGDDSGSRFDTWGTGHAATWGTGSRPRTWGTGHRLRHRRLRLHRRTWGTG